MPVIIFEGPHLTKAQKAELVKEFAEAAARVTGVAVPAFVTLIREYDLDNVGSGDLLLSEKLGLNK